MNSSLSYRDVLWTRQACSSVYKPPSWTTTNSRAILSESASFEAKYNIGYLASSSRPFDFQTSWQDCCKSLQGDNKSATGNQRHWCQQAEQIATSSTNRRDSVHSPSRDQPREKTPPSMLGQEGRTNVVNRTSLKRKLSSSEFYDDDRAVNLDLNLSLKTTSGKEEKVMRASSDDDDSGLLSLSLFPPQVRKNSEVGNTIISNLDLSL